MSNIVKGFKGFDKDLKCRGHKFKIGKTTEHKGELKLCSSGLHFCENPLDVLAYYEPANSRFAEVEAEGVLDEQMDDTKRVCSKLHVKAEVTLKAMLDFGVKFILERVDWKNAKESNTGYRSAATNTGYGSAATNTGYRSAATNTGDRSAATNTGNGSAATNTGDRSAATNTGNGSAATNTGDRSAASVEGKESIAFVSGAESKAKGAKGCWLVLTERDQDWKIITVKTAKVDNKKIKADTYYTLIKGKFVEVK